ncbi:hypothetical protein RFI_14252 [Reticulomyxa filosa]|uniref:Uncharacterized protein n=1 Tax=Reticulomyxa filosa TaxID=46433 RepID=X6NB11_RETFI|nr:hypothetical protein RFI_14252 [Reticulomyxa filosa]|eukprot:ETO22939.1 hypothetical protein RFI_14252 [Reticulomyxa filosa]
MKQENEDEQYSKELCTILEDKKHRLQQFVHDKEFAKHKNLNEKRKCEQRKEKFAQMIHNALRHGSDLTSISKILQIDLSDIIQEFQLTRQSTSIDNSTVVERLRQIINENNINIDNVGLTGRHLTQSQSDSLFSFQKSDRCTIHRQKPNQDPKMRFALQAVNEGYCQYQLVRDDVNVCDDSRRINSTVNLKLIEFQKCIIDVIFLCFLRYNTHILKISKASMSLKKSMYFLVFLNKPSKTIPFNVKRD